MSIPSLYRSGISLSLTISHQQFPLPVPRTPFTVPWLADLGNEQRLHVGGDEHFHEQRWVRDRWGSVSHGAAGN